ncbi:hypothetical protein [Kibdelosporangium philippinense]|uniref:hypothetical protein n=1 Tax=Kibdelosporangium philippinense TaxID=211113 RepID=UPI0036076CD0
MEGQFAGLQVLADQQKVAWADGCDPGPGVAAFALRAGDRADLPSVAARPEIASHHLLSAGAVPRRDRDVEGASDPHHVADPVVLQELP